jgi:hypothetical protein
VAAVLFVATLASVQARQQQKMLSFRSVRLDPKERIVAIEIDLTDARFVSVHIPDDWGIRVEGPIGDCKLSGQSGHGASGLKSIRELDRFVTIAVYDPANFHITVRIYTSTDFEHSIKRTLLPSQFLLRNV